MKFNKITVLILFPALVLFPVSAFALGDPSPAIDSLTALFQSWQAHVAIIAAVLEALLRLLPSKVPLSIAWVVSSVLNSLSKLFAAAAKFLDSVLPQNTKPTAGTVDLDKK